MIEKYNMFTMKMTRNLLREEYNFHDDVGLVYRCSVVLFNSLLQF